MNYQIISMQNLHIKYHLIMLQKDATNIICII